MWWLAVPLVIGAGKLIYDAVTDDDSNSSNSYNDDNRFQEQEIREQAKKEKKKVIRGKINKYKNKVKREMKVKYKHDIGFRKDKVNIKLKNEILSKEIDHLEQEKDELKEALKELEVIKNETL